MKKVIGIVFVIIAIILIVIGGCIYHEKQQKQIVIDEINQLSALDISKDEIDMTIKASGKYGVVERKIKEYLNEYAVYIKEVSNLMQDEQFVKTVTVENYQEDAPEFVKTKTYLSSLKEEFNQKMQKLIDMTTEEAIMRYIEGENLSQTYITLYHDLMFDDQILQELEETKTLLEDTNQKVIEIIETEESMIEILIEYKGNWKIEGDQIRFTSIKGLQEYNALVEKLSNIE